MQRIDPIATKKERANGRFERLCRSRQIAHRERDLGFGHHAARTCGFLVRSERARRSPQQLARPRMLAELCHGDAAQRERWRIVAQRDPLQGAEGIARCECTRRGSDQRVHRNPVTLVTPIVRCPALSLSHQQQPPSRIEKRLSAPSTAGLALHEVDDRSTQQKEESMNAQRIEGAVALVTGANRGIGRALTEALLTRGVRKVYATARNPEALRTLRDERLVSLRLDVTDVDQIRAAGEAASDVELVFNNAGVAIAGGIADSTVLDQARREME